MLRRMKRFLPLLFAASLAACSESTSEEPTPTVDSSTDSTSESSVDSSVDSAPIDSSGSDTTVADTAIEDTTTTDTAIDDVASDTTTSDASDTSASDTGAIDSGTTDTAPIDSGSIDAGPDAAPSCPAPENTGTYDASALSCSDLQTEYPKAIAEAQTCACDLDCGTEVAKDFCMCTTFVNKGSAAWPRIVAMMAEWKKKGCTIICPKILCKVPVLAGCLPGSSTAVKTCTLK